MDTDVESEGTAVSNSDADISDCGDSHADVDMEDGDCAPLLPRKQRQPLWSNSYFYIVDNTDAKNARDVKIRIFNVWTTDSQMGHHQMSRTLTPTHYGETRENPQRSFALLRAWALWRGRLHGWANMRPGRSRQFEHDAVALEREVRSIPGVLLGNVHADARLREWAPDVVERIAGSHSAPI